MIAMLMSVNLMAEQTAANGGAKLPPLPASVSSRATFFGRVERRRGDGEERDDHAERGKARPGACSCGVADGEARHGEEQSVGEHVAVVEHEREVRGAAAFRSPFGHDVRRARSAVSELEAEDRWPVRNVRRVDQFEGHRERDGGYAEQDQRACLRSSLKAVLLRWDWWSGPVATGSS